jgi:hypothetical protein
MARKPKNRREENLSDFAGPNADQEAIETLANAAAAANKKTKGKNVGDASDETVGMHVNLIKAAEIEWRALRDQASQAQGVLRNRYKVAKGDGVDVDSLKLAFRISERSTGEVVSEQRNVGRYLRIMGSPLGTQWSLFDEPDADGASLDATARGEQDGKEGLDRASNPYAPGSSDWFAYNNAWQMAQDKLAEGLGRGNDASGAAAH